MLTAILSGYLASIVIPFTRYDRRGVMGWVYALLPLSLFVFFASQFPAVADGGPLRRNLAWFPELGISFSFHLDMWGLVFSLLITGIGTLVTLYAAGYLGHDARIKRFFSFLFMFMASMLGTVLAGNAILLFVFWELTSLSSYFLIGFEHEEEKSRRNALQALLVTGTGGLAMMAGFLMIGAVTGSYEIQAWIEQRALILSHPLFPASLACILLGAFTKSAQFPFHFWLPNAMVAPTPVSAYLHSSTMVKAGVYLLGRLFPVFGASALWMTALPAAGIATMLIGALLAVRMKEMKRQLAYLTVSALGLLVYLIGHGSPEALQAAAVFLVAHAFYKGALFMVAGSAHHASGARETEKLAGLWKKMPLTAAASVVAGASLASLPPFFGFFAKEMALESTPSYGVAAILIAGTVYTSMFLWIAFRPFSDGRSSLHAKAHEVPSSMWLGALVLACLGLVFPWVFPAASVVWEKTASSILGAPVHTDHHAGSWWSPLLLGSAASWAAGFVLYSRRLAIQAFLDRFEKIWNAGPESAYHALLRRMVGLAVLQTRILQNGSLRYYFRITMAVVVTLCGWGFLRNGFPEAQLGSFYFLETSLAVIIFAGTLAAVRTGEKLSAVVYLGIVGLAISLVFLLFGAPDLAMTQFAVEILTLILLALALYRLPHFREGGRRRSAVYDAALSVLSGFVVFLFVLSAIRPKDALRPTADFYVHHTLPEAHGRNIVNVILVDFRGFDTLGEITVLGIAGIGVYALLKLVLGSKKKAA